MNNRRLRSTKLAIVLAVAVFASLVVAHFLSLNSPNSRMTETAQSSAPARIASVAKSIVAACPLAAPDDAKAFAICADTLSKLKVLDQTVSDQFLWGQQQAVGNYDLKKNPTTLFNPLVWRRLYLATFMFPGTYRVEQVDNRFVLHLPIQFRNQLDLGSYPYPFWHSKKKWESYQTAKELLFVMENGKFAGALRSAEKDASRSTVMHHWNGQWEQAQPTGMLYTKLLSASNPHIAALDQAFRAFEAASRQFNCATCHSPDNAAKMNPLILFNYPNQALSSRHEIVQTIEENHMPPATIVIEGDRKTVTPSGIDDAAEKEKLIQLAKNFAETGDLALFYEKQLQSDRSGKG